MKSTNILNAILVNPSEPAVPAKVDFETIRAALGTVSFAYPYDDPVCLAHDDDGIANRRPPNRTVAGQIVPGPFYVLGISPDGDLAGLSPELMDKYLRLFQSPESFPPGRWKVGMKVKESDCCVFLMLESSWESLP